MARATKTPEELEREKALKAERDRRYRDRKKRERDAKSRADKPRTRRTRAPAARTEAVSGDVVGPAKTPEEIAATHAFEVEQRIKNVVIQMRQSWAALAKDLYEFFSASLWRDLGHDSFEEWLAGPDIDIGRRWAYELISLWREFVVKREVPVGDLAEIEPSKLQEILPAVRRNDVSLETALSDAKALSKTDIRERYKPRGAGTVSSPGGSRPDDSTKYDAGHEPAMVVCPTCGSRVKEEDIRAGAEA